MARILSQAEKREQEEKVRWQAHLDKAAELAKTMQCNCDLDRWQPENLTGHSHVCRIHKFAVAALR